MSWKMGLISWGSGMTTPLDGCLRDYDKPPRNCGQGRRGECPGDGQAKSCLDLDRDAEQARRLHHQHRDQQDEGVDVLVVAGEISRTQALDDPDQKAAEDRPRQIAETAD